MTTLRIKSSLTARSSTGRSAPQLVTTQNTQNTQDMACSRWPELRESGIGSLDAAAAVGLNPFKSQVRLWMEKTGRSSLLHPTEVPDDSSTYWGRLLEPIVAAHYALRTGRKVRRINTALQHPLHPWMLVHVCREVAGSPDVQLLECLPVGMDTVHLWAEGVPDHVRVQVLHQLAVTGLRSADVVALICGQELQIHHIPRDEAVISRLIELERAFWRCVELDQAPPAAGWGPADAVLRALRPSAEPPRSP